MNDQKPIKIKENQYGLGIFLAIPIIPPVSIWFCMITGNVYLGVPLGIIIGLGIGTILGRTIGRK